MSTEPTRVLVRERHGGARIITDHESRLASLEELEAIDRAIRGGLGLKVERCDAAR